MPGPEERVRLPDQSISLNPSQRQRLLITCKHIDKLLEDIEATLHASDSKSVFPNYTADVDPDERKTIEDYVARIRRQLLQVLASQSLTPEEPRISVTHSIYVNLKFIDIAVTELAPRHMQGYGPVSPAGAADLERIVVSLQTSVNQLTEYLLHNDPHSGEPPIWRRQGG